MFKTSLQYYKFSAYGFLKNLRLFEVFFLLYLKESGLSFLEIGLLYSIRQISANFMEIPSGIIADTIGRKKALLFAMHAYLSSFIVFYFSWSFNFFALAMVLYGLGEAFRSGTHKAMIMHFLDLNNLKEYKTQFYGGTRSFSQIGSAISSLLAALIVFYGSSFRSLFLYTSIPYILEILLLYSYPAQLNGVGTRKKNDGRTLKAHFRETWILFISLFKDYTILKSVYSAASFVAIFKSLKDYLQPLLQAAALGSPLFLAFENSQRTAIMIGLVFFAIFLMTSQISRHAWRFEQGFRSRALAINVAYILGVTGIIISGVLYNFQFTMIGTLFFVLLYLIQNIRRPLMVSYLSEQIENKVLTSAMSAENQLQTLVIAVVSPLIGLLVDLYGLGIGLSVTGVAFLLLYPLGKLKHKI